MVSFARSYETIRGALLTYIRYPLGNLMHGKFHMSCQVGLNIANHGHAQRAVLDWKDKAQNSRCRGLTGRLESGGLHYVQTKLALEGGLA